jgi:hypothetical protein
MSLKIKKNKFTNKLIITKIITYIGKIPTNNMINKSDWHVSEFAMLRPKLINEYGYSFFYKQNMNIVDWSRSQYKSNEQPEQNEKNHKRKNQSL